MSFLRHARKIDTTQPEIVDALQREGYSVQKLGFPLDLLVRHSTWAPNCWVMLEAKTKNRKDGFVPDPRQQRQTDFCHAHGVPYIFSAEDALQYLRIRGLKLTEAA
jgi:hypothetical protein